jgi:hypothetical protein
VLIIIEEEDSASSDIPQGNQARRIDEKELNEEDDRHSIESSEGFRPFRSGYRRFFYHRIAEST